MTYRSRATRIVGVVLIAVSAVACGADTRTSTPQSTDKSAGRPASAATGAAPGDITKTDLRGFNANFGRSCIDVQKDAINGEKSAELAQEVARCNAMGITEDEAVGNAAIRTPSQILAVCAEHRRGATPFDKRVAKRCDEIGAN